MQQRSYALLLRALLLGIQLCPILFAVDVILTEISRLLCTCFTFIGLNDTTWLDTIIRCAVDVVFDGSQAACRALATPHHLDAHLLLTLARAATSLACWCALFAALAWLGAVKARLLRRITSRRWWRAKQRALLKQPQGAPPTPHRLRAWLALAIPARVERWYAEWLALLVDELKVRAATLSLFHAAVRIVPGLARRQHLTLAHPVLLLHQLSWRGALVGLSLLAKRRLTQRPRRRRPNTNTTPPRVRHPTPEVVLDQQPPSPPRRPTQPLSWALPHAHSAPSELLSGLGSPPRSPRKKGDGAHTGASDDDDDGAVSSRCAVGQSSDMRLHSSFPGVHDQPGAQPVAPPSPAAIAGAALTSAVGMRPDALGEQLELVVVPVLYAAQFATRLLLALVVPQLAPCRGVCWVSWRGVVGYVLLFWPINGGLLLLVAAAQLAASVAVAKDTSSTTARRLVMG